MDLGKSDLDPLARATPMSGSVMSGRVPPPPPHRGLNPPFGFEPVFGDDAASDNKRFLPVRPDDHQRATGAPDNDHLRLNK